MPVTVSWWHLVLIYCLQVVFPDGNLTGCAPPICRCMLLGMQCTACHQLVTLDLVYLGACMFHGWTFWSAAESGTAAANY